MKTRRFLSLLLSLVMVFSLIAPTTAFAAGKSSRSSGSGEMIAEGVTGGRYTDTTASADKAYKYTITGSDGSEATVAVPMADDEGGSGTETLTTTPEIRWERTEDTYTPGTTKYRCNNSSCNYQQDTYWHGRCPNCKSWFTCTKVTTEGSYNYVPNIAYVNSNGSTESGGVTYDQYTALTWDWSSLDRLINDEDDKTGDVWSPQTDGMSACKFSAHDAQSWDKANVYKISGTFTWPEGYDLNETTITIQSANDSSYSEIYDYINNHDLSDLFPNGKVLPVNDDVYAVMWVGDEKDAPTAANINDYLLFWTGTSGKGIWTENRTTNADDWGRTTPATFLSAGKQGVRAFYRAWPNAVGATAGLNNTDVANHTFDYLAHTDGWYTLTDTSAINSVMRNNYTSIGAGATVHLDLYCFNNSGEGIIDELEVNLATQRDTETTVKVNYYYGRVTTPDDDEHFLGSSVLTNQAYGTSISLPAGTNASQLDYMRASAIIKAGKKDVTHGTQFNNPLVVTREGDNVINVLYTDASAKIIYLTAPGKTVRYDSNSHTLDTVAVTESGYEEAATAQSNGTYKLPDGNTLKNVYSVVTATDPGNYPNDFTINGSYKPAYKVIDQNTNEDISNSYDFIEIPDTLTITYDPPAATYTYDFGVTNQYNTLNDVEQKAKVIESSSDEVEVSGANVTYTPAAADTGDSVDLTLTFTGDYQVTKKLTFVPATNVLYEENLITKGDDWNLTGETLTEAVADNGSTVYGYTNIDAYAESDGFSNGSAYKAELTLEAGETTTRTEKAATFTFTGSGFDLISECGTDTGMLLVKVSDSNGKAKKAYLVDTYFTGDSSDEGTDPIISGTDILDYQVPVIRNLELPYDTYTVTVYGYLVNTAGAVGAASAASYGLTDDEAATAESASSSGISAEDIVAAALDDLDLWDELDVEDVEVSFISEDSVLNGGFGNTAAAGASNAAVMTLDGEGGAPAAGADVKANVYIDGFRVYKPLERDAGIYTTDEENDVKYASVYDFIKNSVTDLDDWIDNAFVYVEYDGDTETAAIADYKIQGPQNEVYLTPGSGIAFALEGYQEGDVVQLAMKSVGTIDATANEATDMTATSATEMYYEVSVEYDDTLGVNYVVITNNESSTGILALSGLKISFHITPMGSEALGEKVIEKLDKTKPASFVPKVLTASAPSSVKSGRNATISIQSSTDDVAAVKLFIDGAEDEIVLTPTNTKAVAAGKSDVYKYSYVVKTKKLDLSTGNHTFTVYAYDAKSQQSAPVTVTITVTQ